MDSSHATVYKIPAQLVVKGGPLQHATPSVSFETIHGGRLMRIAEADAHGLAQGLLPEVYLSAVQAFTNARCFVDRHITNKQAHSDRREDGIDDLAFHSCWNDRRVQ